MRFRFARTTLAAALLAAALGLYAGCGPAKLQLGLDEDTARVARVATYSDGVETALLSPLAVDDTRIVQARALNVHGEPVRNETVGLVSNDEETLKVLTTWGDWPWYYASVRGIKNGTAEIVCTAAAAGVASAITIPVSDAVSSTTRAYIRFLNADTVNPIAVGDSRVFAAEYVGTSGATAEASLVFTLSNTNVARIASSDKSSATVTGLATGEVQLFVRDAGSTAAAGLSLTVR